MKPEHQKAIECYQCPGCVVGGDISCFKPDDDGVGCGKHVAGTMVYPVVGSIFLGMPTGFNRIGPVDNKSMSLHLYDGPEDDQGGWGFSGNGYGVFNVPTWKHLDEHGNTLIRGLSPRINQPFLHVLLGDHMDKIDCQEITTEQIEEMD